MFVFEDRKVAENYFLEPIRVLSVVGPSWQLDCLFVFLFAFVLLYFVFVSLFVFVFESKC